MTVTFYVCDRCGATNEASGWQSAGGLVCPTLAGEVIIRCPEHVTAYAIRRCPTGRIRRGEGVVQGRHYRLRAKGDTKKRPQREVVG